MHSGIQIGSIDPHLTLGQPYQMQSAYLMHYSGNRAQLWLFLTVAGNIIKVWWKVKGQRSQLRSTVVLSVCRALLFPFFKEECVRLKTCWRPSLSKHFFMTGVGATAQQSFRHFTACFHGGGSLEACRGTTVCCKDRLKMIKMLLHLHLYTHTHTCHVVCMDTVLFWWLVHPE